MGNGFAQDAIALAAERVARGTLDRRAFFEGLALLGLGAVAGHPRPALA
jgi:hypothetical protein